MKAKKLTQEEIKKLRYTGKTQVKDGVTISPRCVLWDSELRGFGCRVYPEGRKSFVLSYRVRGVKRLTVLGDFGVNTSDQARSKAKKWIGQIEDGKDPGEELRREKAKGLTVGELWKLYAKSEKFTKKKSWKKDEYRYKASIEPKLGAKSIASVTPEVAQALHANLSGTPYEGNRVVALLSALFTWGRKSLTLPPETVNPAAFVERYQEEPRTRALSQEETGRLMAALDTERNPWAAGAIKCLIFTGCRLSEILGMKWSQVQFENDMIEIPTTKKGEPHAVALSPIAKQVLESLPKEEENEYVFPGGKKGDHLRDIKRPWERILKSAKIDDLRIHDLRRSLGTWLINSGTRLEIVSKVLGHKRVETTRRHYAHLLVDSTREALNSHGAKIEQLAAAAKSEAAGA